MPNACAERGPTFSPISRPVQEWTASSNGFATPCSLNRERISKRVRRDGFLRLRFARGGRAFILYSMASGRLAHGERWSFAEIDSRMEVYECGRPAYINRTRI